MLLLLATAACTRHVPASTPPPRGASQKLAIASSGHLLVTAAIEGRPYVLVLDTGANVTSLSTEAAHELGIAATGSMRINDTILAPTGTVHSLAISGVTHDDMSVVIVDIPDALASGAKGVLGLDFLAQHDIVIDFADEEFGVYPAGMVASSGRDLVRLAYGAHGLILMNVVLDRTTVPAMLDLGAPVSVLNSSAGHLIGARRNLTRIVARTGDTTFGPVPMLVRDLGTFRRLGLTRQPAIVLGTDVFEDRVLAISYRDRVAFVSPGTSR
jgi:aspartyl protease